MAENPLTPLENVYWTPQMLFYHFVGYLFLPWLYSISVDTNTSHIEFQHFQICSINNKYQIFFSFPYENHSGILSEKNCTSHFLQCSFSKKTHTQGWWGQQPYVHPECDWALQAWGVAMISIQLPRRGLIHSRRKQPGSDRWTGCFGPSRHPTPSRQRLIG